jgi:quinoprotein glucose dehydrogenase
MKIRLIATTALGLAAALGLSTAALAQAQGAAKATEWKAWGGDGARNHYSLADQITTANVAQLKPVWVYDPGTTGRGWENTPLLIDGLLYVSDADRGDIIALEPETGKEVWRNKAPNRIPRVRGLTYWAGDGAMKPRIILLRSGKMYGLDLKTGQPVADWPAEGINVTLPSTAAPRQPAAPPPGGEGAPAGPGGPGGPPGGGFGGGGTNASPGLVYKNYIILSNSGGWRDTPGTPGDPRAYDLRTGKLVWRTNLIDPSTWGPNGDKVTGGGSWGILSLDEKTGTVYVPTDSAAPDYVGIWRPGDNKWSDSTVAIDAETGKIKWAFQTHHHDIFDYDAMSGPAVTEITRNGQKIPVVIQTTKPGMVWIFDARNGTPLHGYDEKPVAQSKVPGEQSSPTQPFPRAPGALGRMSISRDTLTKLDPESNAECTATWDRLKLQNAGPFTPPFPEGNTVYLPGSSGAISWGGVSVNPDLGLAFTNVTNIPVYNGFGQTPGATDSNRGYRTIGNFTRFADRFGRPCVDGRIGEMVAFEIASGKIVWRVPLGQMDEYADKVKSKEAGAPNIGPSLATKGGVVFIGATADERFRAFDAKTGKTLWETKMSASGVAGPMTYVGKDGRQYVVIAAGGPGTAAYLTNPQWGYRQTLVAFALPKPGDKEIDIVGPYPKRMPNPGERWNPQ